MASLPGPADGLASLRSFATLSFPDSSTLWKDDADSFQQWVRLSWDDKGPAAEEAFLCLSLLP